jgi:hypothetical protein
MVHFKIMATPGSRPTQIVTVPRKRTVFCEYFLGIYNDRSSTFPVPTPSNLIMGAQGTPRLEGKASVSCSHHRPKS